MLTKWYKNLKERDCLDARGVDGRIIKVDLQETRWEPAEWIHLPRDSNQWRALVNTVMNFLGSYNDRNSLRN
jgi:hypothetical protein